MSVLDFINTTQDDELALFIQKYQDAYFALTGKTIVLQPAQAEMLVGTAIAYMSFMQAQRVNSAANQNIARYATYPALDGIAEPYGVSRLPQQNAKCTAAFNLVSGHGSVIIPAGIRIQSEDGQATFVTQAAIPVAANVDTVNAVLVCDTPGKFANGYAIGTVSVILDPQPYLATVSSIDATNSGSDVETDDGLRSRLFVSSAAFSSAGPDDAYIYWAKTASPLILDVYPDNGGGGLVNLYVLVSGGGATPTEILNAVETICSAKDKRPTSDSVTAYSAAVVASNVSYGLVLYSNVADPNATVAASQAAVAAYLAQCGKKLGVDITISNIIKAAMVDGVSDVVMTAPVANIVIDKTQVFNPTSVTATFLNFNDDFS